MCKKNVIFLKDEDKKRLVSNFFSLTILQVITYILPLLTLPLFSKSIRC